MFQLATTDLFQCARRHLEERKRLEKEREDKKRKKMYIKEAKRKKEKRRRESEGSLTLKFGTWKPGKDSLRNRAKLVKLLPQEAYFGLEVSCAPFNSSHPIMVHASSCKDCSPFLLED